MSRLQNSAQVARLRTFLVISYIFFAACSLVAAFLLSWFGLAGSPWFLATSIALNVWASVTATCHKVSAGDFLGVASIVGIKGISEKKNAA